MASSVELRAAGGLTPAQALVSCSPIETDAARQVTKVKFEQAGFDWQFSADTGRLGCDGNAYWFENDGIRYGLNGFATKDRGYADTQPIGLPDKKLNAELKAAGGTSNPPLRVNIGDMIREASKLCS